MKKNKLQKKLFLNKATVVHLDKPGMKALKGGDMAVPSKDVVVVSCMSLRDFCYSDDAACLLPI